MGERAGMTVDRSVAKVFRVVNKEMIERGKQKIKQNGF